MVTQFGMTERVGAIKLGQSSGEVFLGRDMGHQRDYSEEVAGVVDEEVRRLIETAHDEAWEILVENRDVLDDLVWRCWSARRSTRRTSPRSSRPWSSGRSGRSGCPASRRRRSRRRVLTPAGAGAPPNGHARRATASARRPRHGGPRRHRRSPAQRA